MKTITSMLFGIATLIGSASITATEAANTTAADEKCYEHIVNAASIHGSRYVWIVLRDAYGKGPFDAAVQVYNEAGDGITTPAGDHGKFNIGQ